MKNKVKLGIFFIATFVIFVGAIILLGKIKLKGDGYRIYVDYVFIGDLQENGKVSYRGGGIQIGFIEKIAINPDGTIRVTLFITDRNVIIPVGTKFSIQTVGLGLGEKYIMVSPPSTTTTGMASIAAGSVIKGAKGNRICDFLGQISYPLYITHYPLMYVQMSWVYSHADAPLFSHVTVNAGVFILSIFIAWAALKLYDLPVREWLKKF